jgi:hypothetical protein
MFDLDFGGILVDDVVTDTRVPTVPAGIYAVQVVDCDLKQITGKDGTKYPPVTHLYFEILEGSESGRLIDLNFALADNEKRTSSGGKEYNRAAIAKGQIGRIYKACGKTVMGKSSELKGIKFLLGVTVYENSKGYTSNQFESASEYRPSFVSAPAQVAAPAAPKASADPFGSAWA